MTCSFCPLTKRIEDFIKKKQNDPDSTEKIETTIAKLTYGGGEDRETRFEDVINAIDDRYPEWKTSRIVVPAYLFAGIENKLNWTEQDLSETLSEAWEKFISDCQSSSLGELDPESFCENILKVFAQSNGKMSNLAKLKEQILTLLETADTDTGQLPDFSSLCTEYMKRNFQSYISTFNNIRGRKCEHKVRMRNLNMLKNAAGLNLSNVHLFKDLADMLSKFGIDVAAKVKKKRDPRFEIESDSILIRPSGGHIKVEIQEIKAYSVGSSWRGESQSLLISEKSDEHFKNHVEKGLKQLERDVNAFINIFSFLTNDELKKVRLTTRCIFPNFGKNEIHNSDFSLPCKNCSEIIQFKEDFESSRRRKNMYSSFNQTDVMAIYKKILAVYVGCGSMMQLKTPEDGYKKEKADLEQVSNMMYNNHSRIIMSGILMGPYGSGKTLAMLFLLQRVQSLIEETSERRQVIIIIWDDKARDLLKYYQDQNPAPDGQIFNKSEAFKHFGILDDNIHMETTTTQINQLCKVIRENSVDYEETYLFIDEVLVEICDQDLLGNAPFVQNGCPVDWSGLDPLGITTYIAVTPDSECFLDRKEYSEEEIRENNKKSVITTNVLSRSYRSNICIQKFIQFMQSELKEEGLIGFNPEPRDVCSGHEIVGVSPEWSPSRATEHMMCNRNKDCENCFLNENTWEKIKYFLKDVPQIIWKKEVIIVVIENLVNRRRYKGHEYSRVFVNSWFEKKGFSSSQIKFDFEFEGMESSVMIMIQNHGDMSGSLSNVLSRAISRLFLLSPKDDKYLESAASAKHLTKVPGPYVDDGYGDSTDNEKDRSQPRGKTSGDVGFRSESDEEIQAFGTVRGPVPSDSNESLPDLDSDAFASDDSTSSSSSEDSDSEEDKNFGIIEIYQPTIVLKRSKSIADIKRQESGGESHCYFALLEDIANIFIEKYQFFPSEK